jgi:hypothetical protein
MAGRRRLGPGSSSPCLRPSPAASRRTCATRTPTRPSRARLPGRFHRFYVWANREKGVSELALLLALLAVPIALGVLGICALDMYYTRPGLLAPGQHRHAD